MSYQEDVARMQRHANARAHRDWQRMNSEYEELQNEYFEVLEEADRAQEEGDKYSLDYAYDRLAEIEQRKAPYDQLHAQQQAQQVDPRDAQWNHLNRDYLGRLTQKHGAVRGAQMLEQAAADLPRLGYQRGTPGFYWALEQRLGAFSGDVAGVAYSDQEKTLTPNEACKISGLSPQEWNHAAQVLHRQGRIGRGR